ncbi:5-oxoprolinase subunit PxpB [Dasania sp. GY-MA-18]|uniref:5-oxoprolinase subunit PxpB n=1 Tax=Dasania phycosphaerae TaxID=2950436 RepID=A0A9J6RPN6_9GAMM|nr:MULTISPECIES: 5-oxoprolinase subunit PxpB [Dasania]MCR8923637.1 5-oxoprolinase subunit PxpB [Dasania sp. GY-MA-18]MCZ0866071.1 5-oxoprolinase subunit PxpB [Dasania phycosphaerae]MCZ0869795.1 5-oxoprolinase subunit PxpB [Dasania phycosphaerae]
MKIHVAGENSLILYFGEEANAEVAAQVQAANNAIREQMAELIIDTVPSYASLLVIFDAYKCDHLQLRKGIRTAIEANVSGAGQEGTVVTLPVYYSQESGPDLSLISERSGLSVQEIIDLHQSEEYRVYAIGFAPGFAYLGQVDERIASPRIATPRKYVPKGAVGIADRQTAIYPAPSPGGWNLIGLCPIPMFTPEGDSLMPVAVGDRVKFKAITKAEFLDMGGELDEKFLQQEASA